jgi:hypothetical protein
MEDNRIRLKKLVEHSLAEGGQMPLAMLLEQLAQVGAMRDLVRKFGLTPKGGFRIEKAPAKVLAPLLAEIKDGEHLAEVFELLVPPRPVAKPGKDDAAALAEAKAALAVRETAQKGAEAELAKARDGAARALERAEELQKRLDAAGREATSLRRELDEARRAPKAVEPSAPPNVKALQRQVRDLESECEGFREADAALRRQLAHYQSKIRGLEEANAELEALLPKGKRKKHAPPPEPESERRFLLPRYTPSFYKSLDGKDRKAVERAFGAVHLFCTEGHSYPGLEVKQMGGQDTWSLRASLGLRVYFRPTGDGEVEVLELADREEQNTTLRRLKDK